MTERTVEEERARAERMEAALVETEEILQELRDQVFGPGPDEGEGRAWTEARARFLGPRERPGWERG